MSTSKKKILISLTPLLLILFWWFFQGYIRGYEINVWYQNNVMLLEAEDEISSIKGESKSCEKGKAFHTENVMCYLKVKTNAVSAQMLINKFKNTEGVMRADFLGDLIKEFND
ncbi:hypothetical protein HZF08_20185 [Paenibacillus sp. CGMCC 1.16610]|uniref:Uncharacterized protein n=1 Tax=Paenibacillus anseongense TaxID=2682845 RepID=A0ABW9U910_9BACL|nr:MULTISPECIES: hypothetical protein [Paenibacillus]MBA2940622.1 hypothetical protein [Paenibacillus sp. CGMCC 1.16610]MVQ35798.1 hypothetical protein [Paenibacillus anseongense]